ncbi:MAG: thioredoxin family protein [Ignavibacteriales bacterium]|nr:thioredoxin family protein [Ignavibacteriales bacterium]
MKKQIIVTLLLSIMVCTFAIAQSKKSIKRAKPVPALKDSSKIVTKPLVTFIELGSVRCIPCKAMQPVMKSIEEKYGSQVKIIFYDVWQQDQSHFAQVYKIRLIPTQVFLDSKGNELMRHEGFFPEKDIDAFLQSKGLKPKSNDKG